MYYTVSEKVEIRWLPGSKSLSGCCWQKYKVCTKKEENGPHPHGEQGLAAPNRGEPEGQKQQRHAGRYDQHTSSVPEFVAQVAPKYPTRRVENGRKCTHNSQKVVVRNKYL